MSIYEQRLEKDIAKIRKRVKKLGNGVLEAVRNGTRSVLKLNRDLAAETVLGDLPINRRFLELDHRCHVFIARHLPSAQHLRFVSGVLRLNTTLERIGDYAETMSRAALQLNQPPPETVARDIKLMSKRAESALEQALRAFIKLDVDLARDGLETTAEWGATYEMVHADLIAAGEAGERPLTEILLLMAVLNRLERVIHQARNICEQAIFVATGEVKEGKAFDILFVDRTNRGSAQLAAAFVRKAYPDSGDVECACWQPSEELDESYIRFAAEHSIDLGEGPPQSLNEVRPRLPRFDLIIDLSGDAREHLGEIPFHTLLLNWKLQDATDPENSYAEIVPKLHDLLVVIRGEEEES